MLDQECRKRERDCASSENPCQIWSGKRSGVALSPFVSDLTAFEGIDPDLANEKWLFMFETEPAELEGIGGALNTNS